MQINQDIKTIFWDYDGCIHNSLKIYAPAFRKTQEYLVELGKARPETWTDAEIKKWIGLPPERMWQKFRPDLPENTRKAASALLGNVMQQLVSNGMAELYPGTEETLQILSDRKITMVIISHCRTQYIEEHRKSFALDRFFDKIIATESFAYADKSAILALIKGNYPGPQLMVGDRGSDIEAGLRNNMLTAACTYGYALAGELDQADYKLGSIAEILELVRS